MLVTYPYASMASTWDNRDPGQRDPYGTKGSYLWDNRDPYGTKGSYLWDKGILKGQRDPYGTIGILFMGQ